MAKGLIDISKPTAFAALSIQLLNINTNIMLKNKQAMNKKKCKQAFVIQQLKKNGYLPCAIHSCHILAERLTWLYSLQIIIIKKKGLRHHNNKHECVKQPQYRRLSLLNFDSHVHQCTVEGASNLARICVAYTANIYVI